MCFKHNVNALVDLFEYFSQFHSFISHVRIWYQLLFIFSRWVSKAVITFMFCLFLGLHSNLFMILLSKPLTFAMFVHILVQLYNQVLLWEGLWVSTSILNCWIWLVFVGGDVWTFCKWSLCCLMASGIFLFLCCLFWSPSWGWGLSNWYYCLFQFRKYIRCFCVGNWALVLLSLPCIFYRCILLEYHLYIGKLYLYWILICKL